MTRLPDDQNQTGYSSWLSGHPVIWLSLLFIAPIRLYQWCISPWLGACCRFSPSCSHYAVQAIEDHGAGKGLWLATRRLLRCQPFAHAGYDPVPPSKK